MILPMKLIVTLLIGLLASSTVMAHGMSDADQTKALEAGYVEYIELGAVHMLTGYDHLLFILGVVFFLTTFKDIVKFITAFTIGHCITLIFATILEIQANYYLVDAVIALTVVYKGFDNLNGFRNYLNVKAPDLLAMVFSFGLIHGFGLSTRLQQLPLGEDGLIMRIIAFNVGVEVGQIAALTIMLLALSGWRKTESFRKFSNAANAGLIAAGFMLVILQLHGYVHTSNAEEFPLKNDNHAHTDAEMKANPTSKGTH